MDILAAVGPSAVEKANPRTDEEIDDFYENNDVARYTTGINLTRSVCSCRMTVLLMPHVYSKVYEYQTHLTKVLNRRFCPGDTSYGDCCVDEVAASHLGAQAVTTMVGHVCSKMPRCQSSSSLENRQ